MAGWLALVGAVAATAFLVDLARDHVRRPRPHVAAWAVAIAMFGAATWLLFVGLRFGWTPGSYRAYYWLGAIVNVPVLAVGSVYLNFGRRAGHAAASLMVVAAVITGWVVLATGIDRQALAAEGVARGSAVFVDRTPAILAGIFSPLGALVVLVLSLVAVVRFWGSRRGLAVGNLLIVLAILVLSVGGVRSTAYGGSLLAGTLLAGILLLWAGYRVATGARREVSPR